VAVEAFSCNSCGAPLAVPAGARVATCSRCGARLRIQRSASALYTEAVERVEEHAREMDRHLEETQARNELEALDMHWKLDQQRLFIHNRNSPPHQPTHLDAVPGVIIGAIGLLFTAA